MIQNYEKTNLIFETNISNIDSKIIVFSNILSFIDIRRFRNESYRNTMKKILTNIHDKLIRKNLRSVW